MISVFECRSLLMKAGQADEHFWTCAGEELEELEGSPVNQSAPGSRCHSRVEVEHGAVADELVRPVGQ